MVCHPEQSEPKFCHPELDSGSHSITRLAGNSTPTKHTKSRHSEGG